MLFKGLTVWRWCMAIMPLVISCAAAAHDRTSTANCLLHFATTDYPPYSGPSLQGGGAMNTATSKMFARLGCQVVIDYLPWARVYVAKGRYDGILLLWPGEVKAMGLIGYQPIFTSRLGFFGLSNRAIDVSSEQALKSSRIGLTRGYGYPGKLRNAGFRLDESNDDISNIRKLLAGHVDLVALEKASGQFLIDRESHLPTARIVWQEPAYAEMPLGIAIVADKPESTSNVKLLAQAVAQFKATGELAKIARQYSVDPYPISGVSR